MGTEDPNSYLSSLLLYETGPIVSYSDLKITGIANNIHKDDMKYQVILNVGLHVPSVLQMIFQGLL